MSKSLEKEIETKKMLVEQVEMWLKDYEMPISAYNVISALMSLGYLSSRPTRSAVDGLTLYTSVE